MNKAEKYKQGYQNESFWQEQNKRLEGYGQNMAEKDKSKWTENEKMAWKNAHQESINYIKVQDKANIKIRQQQYNQAVKKYGKTNVQARLDKYYKPVIKDNRELRKIQQEIAQTSMMTKEQAIDLKKKLGLPI